MKISIVSALLVSLSFLACKGGGSLKAEQPAETKQVIKYVSVPMMLETPEERAEYLGTHFWDNFDFTDTLYISKEVTEQAFADYVAILGAMPVDKGRESLKAAFGKAHADSMMFDYFNGLAEKYFDDPNSPFRNEELYIGVLEYMISSDRIDGLEKMPYRYKYNMTMKNRLGEKAGDFTYKTMDGRESSLYKIRADYTLIFFNNPGCSACKAITEQIVSSPVLNSAVKSGEIKILALYPDKDLREWEDYAPNIPKEWINAYNPGQVISDKELYDLRAIPSLYLLDRDKKVLLKDTAFEQLEAFFAFPKSAF